MAQQGIDYAKLAAQSGGAASVAPPAPPNKADAGVVDYAKLASDSGGTPHIEMTISADDPPEEAEDTGGAQGFFREMWKRVSPVVLAKAAYGAAKDPIGTATNIVRSNPQFLEDAKAAADKGDYATALRKLMSYGMMGFGHDIDAQAEMFEDGRYAEGFGAMTGTAANFAAPVAIGKASTLTVRPPLRNPNPAVREAAREGAAAGVPVDMATASGNAFVANTQKATGQTLGGSVVAGRAARRQVEALEQRGRALADDVHPSAMTPETAGASVTQALDARIANLNSQANQAYSELRRLEAASTPQNVTSTVQGRVAGGGSIPVQQTTQVRMAVDVKAAKDALRPLYDRLLEKSTTLNLPLPKGEAAALQALHGLMKADDFAPLSIVDEALGGLKALNRSNDTMAMSGAHAITSGAVRALDRQVVLAARNAGPDALQALLDGRKATVAKYHANDVLESVAGRSGEPVAAFRATTQSADAAINRLRQVARETPDQMPRIGRAVLDDLFETATKEGGFSRADGLFRAWNNLGNETKKLLYSKPGQVQALDNFFLLAKKISESPNPSGSTLTAVSTAELTTLGAGIATGNLALVAKSLGFALTTAGLSKMMYSPRLVRLLTEGMTMPAAGPRVAAWANAFTRAARDAGVELVPVPAAGAEGTTTSPEQRRQ